MKMAKRLLAMLLCVCMIMGLASTAMAGFDYAHNEAASSDGYYDIISKKDWDIAPGITETEIVLNNEAGDRRQVVHLMSADINNEYTRVISSYTRMDTTNYAISTIPEHAAFLEEEWGENVVGAMNTCLSWYNSAAYAEDPSRVNEPLGFMMVDGEVLFDHSVGFPTVVVIHKDTNDAGETRPTSIPKVEMRTVTKSADLNGWEYQVIPVSAGFIVKDGVNQYKSSHGTDTAARSVVGIKADGSIVIMMNDGRQSPYSLGMNMYECAEVMIAAGCVYAANCDGGGSSTFMSQRPGEELKVNCSPCDGALRQNTHGIMIISTAPATGEFNSAYLSTEYDYYTPYSSIPVNAVGLDMSGAEAEIPADAAWILADDSFGAIANGVFTSNGKLGDVTAQLMYNGNVVGSTTFHIANPEHLTFAQAGTVIPYGKSINLEFTATIGEFNVAYTAADFTWELSDETAATLDGLRFTATEDNTKTGVKVTATYKHADLGSTTMEVAYGKGSEIIWSFEDGDISNWMGIADARAWLKENNIPECANLFQGGNFSPENTSTTFLASAENGGHVKNGQYALGVEVDFTHASFSGWTYNMFFNVEGQTVLRDVSNGMNATRLGMWVYIPEELWEGDDLSSIAAQTQLYGGNSTAEKTAEENVGAFQAHLTLSTSTKRLNALKDEDIPEDRWVYCYIDLTGYEYVSLQNPEKQTWREPCFMRFYTQNYTPKNLIFYFDDITLDYSTAVDDRDAPVIGDITVNTSGTNMRSFNAPVADFAASNTSGLDISTAAIYVDGVALPGVTVSGTTMSSADVNLSCGSHTVSFVIKDNLGNTMRKSKSFTVEGSAPVTLGGHNATGAAPEYDSVYYADINVADIAAIDTVTATIKLSTANTWEAEHLIAAPGVDATYTFNRFDNTVTVTATKTNSCSLTGAQTLVSVPLRVWSWNEEESGITEEAQFASGLGPKVSIDMKVTYGSVTFEKGFFDGYVGTFGGNMLVKTAIDDVNTLWHDHVAGEPQNKAATCTEDGYTGRVFCVGCNCTKYKADGECTHNNGCEDVIEWGTTVPALDHEWHYDAERGIYCSVGDHAYNGELTGSYYLDGVMCTFDEDGTYLPDYKYDGWFEINDTVMYFVGNKYVTGYHKLDGKYCYFDKNGFALDGIVELCGTECLFDNGVSVPTETVTLAGLCGEDAAFVIHRDGRMIVDGNGPMTDYINVGLIPWYGDESIRTSVKELTIGKGLTTIGIRSFYSMSSLKKVTFEEGSQMLQILTHAFSRNTSLETIVIPEGVNTLGVSAFYNCTSLRSIYLPWSVQHIVANAFDGCTNTTIYVPANSRALELVKSYGYKYEIYAVENAGGKDGDINWALNGEGILEITGNGAMPDYAAGTAPWNRYAGQITTVKIGEGVTNVGKFSFYGCKALKNIELASTVTAIGWGSFGYCSALETVTIPDTVETIGDYAFYYCTALKTVNISENSGLVSIGAYAFRNDAALESVYIPNNTTIGTAAFYACGKVTLSVQENSDAHKFAVSNKVACTVRPAAPKVLYSGVCGENAAWELYNNGVLKISGTGKMADWNAATAPWQKYVSEITSIEIGEGITYVGKFNFYGCNKVTAITFSSTVKTIGWGAFGYCSALETVTIPDTVQAISDYAFYFCTALKNVIISENSGLVSIGAYAFRNDTALESVYIPNDTTIGTAAFYACDKVNLSVEENSAAHKFAVSNKVACTVRPAVPEVIYSGVCGENAAWELYNNGVLKISGTGKMADWNAATAPWQKYVSEITSIEIGEGITYVGKFNFYGCNKVTAVTFSSTVETIGWGAFGYCSALVSVTIPAGVNTLMRYAFYQCENLASVTFAQGSELAAIERYAFLNDANLTNVVGIPANADIDTYAFFGSGYTPA